MTERELDRRVARRLAILRYRGEGHSVALTCRRYGIARETYHKWQRRFRGLLEVGFDTTDQARRAISWWLEDAYRPGPPFDIGLITAESLERVRQGGLLPTRRLAADGDARDDA